MGKTLHDTRFGTAFLQWPQRHRKKGVRYENMYQHKSKGEQQNSDKTEPTALIYTSPKKIA